MTCRESYAPISGLFDEFAEALGHFGMKSQHPILEVFQRQSLPLAGAWPFNRKKRCRIYFQGFRQDHQFGVSHATQLRFNLREGRPAQFQAQDRASGGEHFLCQSPLVAQFSDLRADNIFIFRHAPETELDNNQRRTLDCSVIGATCFVWRARKTVSGWMKFGWNRAQNMKRGRTMKAAKLPVGGDIGGNVRVPVIHAPAAASDRPALETRRSILRKLKVRLGQEHCFANLK